MTYDWLREYDNPVFQAELLRSEKIGAAPPAEPKTLREVRRLGISSHRSERERERETNEGHH